MAAALAKIFGSGKKGEPPSPQAAIQKLRETEGMLGKKSEFMEKKIEKEMQTVKKNGMKNKRGKTRWVWFVYMFSCPYSLILCTVPTRYSWFLVWPLSRV